MPLNINDLKALYFGGGADAEYEFYEAAADAGVTASELLGLRELAAIPSAHWVAAYTTAVTANTQPESWLEGSPILLPNCTLDRIALDVTIGGAGSLYRLGIYDASFDLVLDAGTITSSGTGVLPITINQSISAGLHYLVAVQQNGGSAATVRQNSGNVRWLTSLSDTGLSLNTVAGYAFTTNTTGALPASITPTSTVTRCARVMVRAA
jgi:hypothetical protein